MRYKFWIWKLKIRHFSYGLVEAIVNGFWLSVGDIFWQFPNWRDNYYSYRERCWQSAQEPMSFAWWLRSQASRK